MSCSKYTLTNNGSSLAKFSYRRCSDNMDFFNIGIDQGSFKNIWFVDGTFSKDGDIEIVNSISPFPSPTACQRIPAIEILFSSDTMNDFYKSSNPGNEMDFDIYLNNSTNCTIEWGDGNTDTYTGTYMNPTHTYLSDGLFIIKVTFDDFNEVNELNIYNMPVTQVNGCEFLTSLEFLYIENCILTSFDTLSAPLSPILEELYLDDNWLTSFTPSYLLPDSLVDFDISNNYYLKTLTLLEPLPSNLDYFDISDCGGNYPSSYYGYGVPGEDGGITSPFNYTIPNSVNNMYLYSNKISEFNPTFDILNSQLTYLGIGDNSLTSFDVNLPDSLTDLEVETNPLTSFNPVFSQDQTSGTLTVGREYTIQKYNASDNFTSVANVQSGVINTDGCVFIATGTTPVWSASSILTVAKINDIEAYDTELTTYNPSVALPSSLRYLDFSDNKPYGGVGSNQGTFGQSGLTTFDPTIALPNGLLNLDLSNNSLIIFNPTPNIPTTITYLSLQDNLFTTAGTNNTLYYLSNILTGPVGNLYLDGTGNAGPTVGPPDGTAAVTTLQGNGYSVYTN